MIVKVLQNFGLNLQNFCIEDSSEKESDQGPVSDSEDEENEGGQERQAHTTSETEVEVLTPATTPIRVIRAQLRSQLRPT